MTPIDLQGCRQAPGTARQIQKTMGLAVTLHELDAFQRFQGADQDGRRDSLGLAHNIQHEMRAIVKENVGMARCKIHRADARGWTAVMMPGGIARRIRFRFNDAAAEASGRKFVDDDFSDEEASQSYGVRRQLRAAQAADGDFWLGFFHGLGCLFVRCACRLGQDALQVIGGNQILILRVFAQETCNVTTNRDDSEMIGARKIERRPCQLGGKSFSFERRGHFRMDKVDAVGEPAVSE
jgi:hypothetical protein